MCMHYIAIPSARKPESDALREIRVVLSSKFGLTSTNPGSKSHDGAHFTLLVRYACATRYIGVVYYHLIKSGSTTYGTLRCSMECKEYKKSLGY